MELLHAYRSRHGRQQQQGEEEGPEEIGAHVCLEAVLGGRASGWKHAEELLLINTKECMPCFIGTHNAALQRRACVLANEPYRPC